MFVGIDIAKELRDLNKYVEDLKQERGRWVNRLEQDHCSNSVKDGIGKKIQELDV
jgi:hypothetical protein